MWHCAVGMGGGRVAYAALCRGDWSWACRIDGAASLGLLGKASNGCRRVIGRRGIGIAGQGVV